MSRPGTTTATEHVNADPRFQFPHTSEPTRCQLIPRAFDYNGARSKSEDDQRLKLARNECGSCPIATECLLWALVNQSAARVGVWAATTPRERTQLRKRIADRLGPNWVDILAGQEQSRCDQTAAARHTPLTVNQARIVRLDSDLNGPMPRPRTLTFARQRRNRDLLQASVRSPRPERKLGRAS